MYFIWAPACFDLIKSNQTIVIVSGVAVSAALCWTYRRKLLSFISNNIANTANKEFMHSCDLIRFMIWVN